LHLGLSIEKGSVSNLEALRHRLQKTQDRRCLALDKRIERWCANRPQRHLLAHATLHCLRDDQGREVVVTRHLPRDKNDVTPDRMWSSEERNEVLRQAAADGRSIEDQIRNILADSATLAKLKA
jgi:hypothetical protein